jgi:SLOG in TRPM, prokaryote/SMODS and SLOG-associating 2TM effector domain 1/Protein of unknown function (DUF4231)
MNREITFPNGNNARLVVAPARTCAGELAEDLRLKRPKALMMIAGGADEMEEVLKSQLESLFSAVARAAAEMGALIIDGGTHAGVMALIGRSMAEQKRKTPLLGIAPSNKVSYPGGPFEDGTGERVMLDANHSHFILVEADNWGDETATMYEVAEQLAPSSTVLTLLVNGGPIAKEELLQSVWRGWPVIVIEGSGRLADTIAHLWRKKTASKDDAQVAEINDHRLAQIVADGDIHLFPSNGSAADLERMILRLAGDSTLRMAWERFAVYDYNAQLHQKSYKKLLMSILILGVLGTLLALTQQQLRSPLSVTGPSAWVTFLNVLVGGLRPLMPYLHYLIVLIPITTSVLLAAANRFQSGKKWILLRGGAEALKRETYCYRTQAGIYSDQQLAASRVSREIELARQVETINLRLSRTEIKSSALKRYQGPIPPRMYGAAESDDGFTVLTPNRYVVTRLGGQINYYEDNTNNLERRLKWLQWSIYIIGGMGTFLAAVGAELWIALTTAIVTALTVYVSQNQIEDALMSYNQALSDLNNIRAWWAALPAAERADQKNIDKLVLETEKILEGESAGWVQKMQVALTGQRKAKEAEDETIISLPDSKYTEDGRVGDRDKKQGVDGEKHISREL